MFRISIAEEGPKEVVLRLEGRLVSEWLLVLAQECRQQLRLGRRVVLDVSGVTTIDPRSVQFVRTLQKCDVKVINPSVLTRDLLLLEDP